MKKLNLFSQLDCRFGLPEELHFQYHMATKNCSLAWSCNETLVDEVTTAFAKHHYEILQVSSKVAFTILLT
jgi:hypothetical protein